MSLDKCAKCGYPISHPFGIRISTNSCAGCDFSEQKKDVNWNERFDELKAIAKRDPKCLLIVDSNPKSFYALEKLLNAGFEVTCTHFNSLMNTLEGHENFAKLRNSFDVEFITRTQGLPATKKIVKETILNHGSLMWHFNAGQRIHALKTAESRGIYQIFIAEHKGNEQTGMYDAHEEIHMTYKSWIDHDLSGQDPTLLRSRLNLEKSSLNYFKYPENVIKGDSQIVGRFLSYFDYWNSPQINQDISQRFKLKSNLYSKYTINKNEDINTFAKLTFHNYLKKMKYGFTTKLDQSVQWNRNGFQINSVDTHDEIQLADFEQIAEWLETSIEAIILVSEKFINPRVWEAIDFRIWKSRIGNSCEVIDHSKIKVNKKNLINSIFWR